MPRISALPLTIVLLSSPPQAAVSHLTSPATLLLSATPLAILGSSLPIWAAGLLGPWRTVMATAVLSGLGNSMGWVAA